MYRPALLAKTIELAKANAYSYIGKEGFGALSPGSDEYYALVLNFMENYAGPVDNWAKTFYDRAKADVFLGTAGGSMISGEVAGEVGMGSSEAAGEPDAKHLDDYEVLINFIHQRRKDALSHFTYNPNTWEEADFSDV